MEKWKYEHFAYPLNKAMQSNYRVYADNGAKTPICSLPCSLSETQSPTLLERQEKAARLIAAAPAMLLALEVAQFAISIEDSEAYSIVVEAIKLAKGESK